MASYDGELLLYSSSPWSDVSSLSSFSIPLPFIFQEAKESIDEEDPRPTSSNGAYTRTTSTGTTDVKRSRINTLTHEYELFRINTNENIQSMHKRFTHIVNHLASLGKIFPNEDLINKFFRGLSTEWQPKVTAISESKDLYSMSLATLFG